MIQQLQKHQYKAVYKLTIDELGYHELEEDTFYACLDQMQKHSDYETFVMVLEDIVVGYIGVCREYAYNYAHYVMQITALCVDNTYQHKGVGTALIQYIEELARNEGVTSILVHSGLHRCDAHRFYEQNGFMKKSFVFKKQISDT